MLTITCPENYPEAPPIFQFNSKINLPCVNQTNGTVEKTKFHMFSNWNSGYTLEKILIGLKNEMSVNKKLAQPPDGDMF